MNDLFKLFDAYPAIPIGMMAVIIVIALVRRGRRARASNQTAAPTRTKLAAFVLDQVLFWWTAGRDSFRVRDLLNGGCLILGRAGSGKTSSSGARLQAAIVGHPKSAGLLLAAKPEDAGDIVRIFHKARRLKDLIVFDASRHWRCNFLGCLKRPRDVVTFLTTMSEVLQRGDSKGGGDNSRFYDTQQDRCIYNAAAALQAAREPITAPNLHKFIMTAATTQAQLHTPEWQKKYHAKVLARGFETKLSPLEAHDFQLCVDYWVEEWAGSWMNGPGAIFSPACRVFFTP